MAQNLSSPALVEAEEPVQTGETALRESPLGSVARQFAREYRLSDQMTGVPVLSAFAATPGKISDPGVPANEWHRPWTILPPPTPQNGYWITYSWFQQAIRQVREICLPATINSCRNSRIVIPVAILRRRRGQYRPRLCHSFAVRLGQKFFLALQQMQKHWNASLWSERRYSLANWRSHAT